MFKLLDVVTPIVAIDKVPFNAIGTIVDIYPDNFYEVEFCDADGIPILEEITITLSEDSFVLSASLRGRMAALIGNMDVDLDAEIIGEVAL